ncbi:hypothetical protein P5V15_010051, partial [Pogonomyrmex californicus]
WAEPVIFIVAALRHVTLAKDSASIHELNLQLPFYLIKFTNGIYVGFPNDSPIFPHFIRQCISLLRSAGATAAKRCNYLPTIASRFATVGPFRF